MGLPRSLTPEDFFALPAEERERIKGLVLSAGVAEQDWNDTYLVEFAQDGAEVGVQLHRHARNADGQFWYDRVRHEVAKLPSLLARVPA